MDPLQSADICFKFWAGMAVACLGVMFYFLPRTSRESCLPAALALGAICCCLGAALYQSIKIEKLRHTDVVELAGSK